VEGSTSTYADTVNAMGFFPINLTSQVKAGQQQQFVYPVALLHYKDQTLPIELYKGKTPLISFQELNSAEAMLEYQFAKAIDAVTRKEMPIVAYATGNGEPMGYNTYDLVENALKPNFRFFSFDLLNQPFIPEDFSALIVVKPSLSFTDEEKLKLDQYVMRGGKLLLFIDRLNAEMDSLQQKNEVVAYDQLLPRLTALAGEGYDRRIFIRAAEKAPYGIVMQVMARVNSAGYRNLGLVTDTVEQ
jgi:hypothetical protein